LRPVPFNTYEMLHVPVFISSKIPLKVAWEFRNSYGFLTVLLMVCWSEAYRKIRGRILNTLHIFQLELLNNVDILIRNTSPHTNGINY
jgi:hypothetical protein